jgi:hypothetical protein
LAAGCILRSPQREIPGYQRELKKFPQLYETRNAFSENIAKKNKINLYFIVFGKYELIFV